jgi:hypothetical protein
MFRAHILHDLQPYICTYADCPESNRLYSSRRQWVEHENHSHRRIWRCYEHSTPLFYSPERLEAHLREDHANVLTETQIAGLIEVAETSVIDSRPLCPICLAAGPFAKGMENHLANHLERIAVFALPKGLSGGAEGSDASSNASQGRGARSQSSWASGSLVFSETGAPREADFESETLAIYQEDEVAGPNVKEAEARKVDLSVMREAEQVGQDNAESLSLSALRQSIFRELSAELSTVELEIPATTEGAPSQFLKPVEVLYHYNIELSGPGDTDVISDHEPGVISIVHVLERMDKGDYADFKTFMKDVRSLSTNIMKYYGGDSDAYTCAASIQASSICLFDRI